MLIFSPGLERSKDRHQVWPNRQKRGWLKILGLSPNKEVKSLDGGNVCLEETGVTSVNCWSITT